VPNWTGTGHKCILTCHGGQIIENNPELCLVGQDLAIFSILTCHGGQIMENNPELCPIGQDLTISTIGNQLLWELGYPAIK
jgi:hypothetical protein